MCEFRHFTVTVAAELCQKWIRFNFSKPVCLFFPIMRRHCGHFSMAEFGSLIFEKKEKNPSCIKLIFMKKRKLKLKTIKCIRVKVM